jgi:DNA-binding transcriptional regulator YhcF (GntR family)
LTFLLDTYIVCDSIQEGVGAMTEIDRVSLAVFADLAAGRIPPGGKLPTFAEMERAHGVSYTTINACVKRLKRSGLVFSRERRGVFVAERPPSLTRFAFVFPAPSRDNRFLQTLRDLLAEECARHDIGLEVYPAFEPDPANSDYRNLLAAIYGLRLAGVVCFEMPPLPENCELPRLPGIPLIDVAQCFQMSEVPYIAKCRAYLLSKGRTRIAAIFLGAHSLRSSLIERLRQANLTAPDHWFVGAEPHNAESIARLLLDYPRDQRPDGLIIADDNLVDRALRGVYGSGARVPDELEIVAHCNWPNPVPTVIPVQRLGWDVREIATSIIANLLRSRGNSGWQTPEPRALTPLFEGEAH